MSGDILLMPPGGDEPWLSTEPQLREWTPDDPDEGPR
jgi:hypothetical protein